MISLTKKIPQINKISAEYIKIKCLNDAYFDDKDVLFWVQNENDAIISLADGNMIIYNNNADFDELSEFISVISPLSIFSDYDTLLKLRLDLIQKVNVMFIKPSFNQQYNSDKLSSKELYSILNIKGLDLPQYPFFAVDFCRRLNRGFASYFAIDKICAAILFETENYEIINGIASHKKGYGTIALRGLLNNKTKITVACCTDLVKNFYVKNGFKKIYNAGYWVKNK